VGFFRQLREENLIFHTDARLQFRSAPNTPNAPFARALQQVIDGVEGKICVAMQYIFQAFGVAAPNTARCC
jgi:Mn-containing catalase